MRLGDEGIAGVRTRAGARVERCDGVDELGGGRLARRKERDGRTERDDPVQQPEQARDGGDREREELRRGQGAIPGLLDDLASDRLVEGDDTRAMRRHREQIRQPRVIAGSERPVLERPRVRNGIVHAATAAIRGDERAGVVAQEHVRSRRRRDP